MWIQVRLITGSSNAVRIDNLSKLTRIEDLRKRLVEPFEVEEKCQRLFFRGKQMEDGHTLFDYNVGLNDIVQLMIRKNLPPPVDNEEKSVEGKLSHEDTTGSDKENREPNDFHMLSTSTDDNITSTYKPGDIIDARDYTVGAWFEAKILKVEQRFSEELVRRMSGTDEAKKQVDTRDSTTSESGSENPPNALDFGKPDGCTYHVCFEKYPEDILQVNSTEIRPRARTLIRFPDVKMGEHIMANYNYEDPESRGFWYDCWTTDKKETRTVKELYATVYIGSDLMPLHNCKLIFTKEIFGIEKPGTQITEDDISTDPSISMETRESKPECEHCNDIPRRNCKRCGCLKCGDKKDPEKTILCDECNQAYHLYCLSPPLDTVPEEDEWYCPECKNDDSHIVKKGEKLKVSKKKLKMASANSSSSRDWGKGMACVGRSKVCTIVSSNHFGAIPGVEVGTLWKFRVQVSEAGVHRPHVAGIHGREEDGAFSIVLSGGYEDDADNGEEFYYTGSGGRDLSGNKRTAEQSCDQTLTRMNRALAKNCNASLNNKAGAEATDWKAGKPVRVVRNCKGRKHSTYAPEEGNRYDGIYKVVKYWPEKGKSGFLVWRYLLRRDDLTPAPWTKAGKKRISEMGLEMQYPEGYLESQKEKEQAKEKEEETTPGKKKGRKRKSEAQSERNDSEIKKQKISKYQVSDSVKSLIKKDLVNKKLWDEAMSFEADGSKVFHEKVEELFLCICCQDIVCKPVTLDCAHNICKSCLSRSFKAEVYSCPACRGELNKKMVMSINKNLSEALNELFPGYENGR